MAQVRVNNPSGFFNGTSLVQYGTPGATTLVPLIDSVSSATGDGQYEINFVSNELLVYGSGVNGPNIHVVKLTNGLASPYDTRVLKMHTFTVVNGSIAGNRDVRNLGGVGNNNVMDGAFSTTKLDPATFMLQNLTDCSVVDLTTTNGYVLTYDASSGKWLAAAPSGGGGGITPPTAIVFNTVAGGSSFQPYGGATAAKYFVSTTTFAGGIGMYIHIMGIVTVSNTSLAGYYGFGIGKTGDTRMVFIGYQGQGSSGPAVIYDNLLAGSGSVLSGYQNISGPAAFYATNSAARFDMHIVVNSSSNIMVGGTVHGLSVGNGVLNDIDLTGGSLTIYGIGAVSTDAVVQYTTIVY